MPRLHTLILVLATAIGLSACASTIPPEKLKTIKSVAVISATGDHFNWSTKPTLGWSQTRVILLPEWEMDSHINKVVSNSLSSRFKIVTAEGIDIPFLTSISEYHATDYLRRHPGLRESGADAVVLVREGWVKINNPGEAPPRVDGIGMFRRNSLIGPVITAYAVLNLVFIDLRTSERIAIIRPRFSDAPWVSVPISHPLGPNNDDLWVDPFEETPADKKDRIRQMLYDLLDRSIPVALQDHGLVN